MKSWAIQFALRWPFRVITILSPVFSQATSLARLLAWPPWDRPLLLYIAQRIPCPSLTCSPCPLPFSWLQLRHLPAAALKPSEPVSPAVPYRDHQAKGIALADLMSTHSFIRFGVPRKMSLCNPRHRDLTIIGFAIRSRHGIDSRTQHAQIQGF